MNNNNIYQRMSAITTEMQTVAKNLEVGYGKGSYKAVSETDVLRAVKPVEAKYGVYSYPYSRQIVDSGTIESNTGNAMFLRLEVVYRFVNVDNPTEYIDITTYGDGIDRADKATGKAMTYADKYALLKAYKINTGEDPDAAHSNDIVGENAENKAARATAEQLRILAEIAANLPDRYAQMLNYYGVSEPAQLTVKQASAAIAKLGKVKP